jgi:hypothetical protein
MLAALTSLLPVHPGSELRRATVPEGVWACSNLLSTNPIERTASAQVDLNIPALTTLSWPSKILNVTVDASMAGLRYPGALALVGFVARD